MLNLAKITTRQEVADLQKIGSDVQWLCYIIHKDHDAFDLEMVRSFNAHLISCNGRRKISQNVKDEYCKAGPNFLFQFLQGHEEKEIRYGLILYLM